MPIHSFKCKACEREFEVFQTLSSLREIETCECGKEGYKIWSTGANVRIFKPAYFEHIDEKPLFISSKKQLMEECKKRGLRSDYIENSFNRRF